MQTLHLEIAGKSTRVALYTLPRARPRSEPVQRTLTGPIGSRRLISGIRKSPADLSFDALRDSDPELDLAVAGTAIETDSVSTAYFERDAPEAGPVGDFKDVDIVYDALGVEKARRPHLKRSSNLDDLHPVKLTKRIPLAEALSNFVIKSTLQVAHVDGLTFDFLHTLARDLASKQEVAVLGAGAKGNLPLVLREGGSPYRAFLAGEVESAERYTLLLLISDQELKLPEARA
ncbi:MAG: hypothetical protein ACT4NL_05025 [Pseudomarimonas sp.]